MSVIHNLKIAPGHFASVIAGEKKAELRMNDRNFKCGDFILLREWRDEFTGNVSLAKVTHLLPVGDFIITGGNWVVMSISLVDEKDVLPILAEIMGEEKSADEIIAVSEFVPPVPLYGHVVSFYQCVKKFGLPRVKA